MDHNEYDLQTYQDYLLEEPTSESSPISNLLFIAWGVICILGLIVIFLLKQSTLGITMIALPTGIAMFLNANFAFYMFVLTLPILSGIGFGETFTVTKAVGYAFLMSFVLNTAIGKMAFKINRVVLIVLAFFAMVIASLMINDPLETFTINTLSYIQFAGFFCVVFWLIYYGGKKVLLNSVRAYLAGVICMLLLSFLIGGITRSISENTAGRLSAGLGEEINSNELSVIIGTGLIIAIYILIYDRSKLWRLLALFSIFVFPLNMILTGSRGTLIALFGTFTLPFVTTLKPRINLKVLIILLILVCITAGLSFFILTKITFSNKFTKRLTAEDTRQAFEYRMFLNKTAIQMASHRPFGTGRTNWFERSQLEFYPHNDICYNTALYGIPAGILLIVIWVILGFKIKRLSISPEKMLARSFWLFYLIIGLKGMYSASKLYWMIFAIIAAAIEIGRNEENLQNYHEVNEEIV